MIDSVEGGADPVLTFADSILDRYGVETGGSALGAGPAIFAESVAGPLFGGIVPDTDDILGRMGRMGSISLWLSYMDDHLGARSGPGRGRPLGYRRFLSLDPYYLAVEAAESDLDGDWPLWKGDEAEAYEDPEAWKYWTLFPDAPVPDEGQPAATGPVADGPWSSTGAKGRPLAAGLDPALRGRTRPDIGAAGQSSLVAGRGLIGAWSVSARSLPALASGLSAASRRGVGEVIGGAWGAPADPSLVHLARTGLSPISAASATPGAAPELRRAGLVPGGAAAAVTDPRMAKMGVSGWGGGSQDPSGSAFAGAWGALGGPSLLGPPQGWGPEARPDAALPSLPRGVARMLPRGWRDLVGADAGSTPLRTPLAPVSAAEAARLLRSAPEVSRWFRFVGRRAVSDPAAAPGLPGARALDAAYIAWVESVRQASDWSTGVAATALPAHHDQQWGQAAERAAVDALPSELRAAGRVLQQSFPGASGDLARRLERQLPAFVRSLLQGGTQRDAAAAASLPHQVAEALAKALTPTLRKAGAFMPQGMVDTGGRAGADEPWPTSAGGRGGGSLADAPYAPILSVLVQRAQARGVLKTGVTGLAPAQLLDALSTGRAAQGLPGAVLSLLRDIRSGAQAAMSAPRAAQALRSLLDTPTAPTSGAGPGGPWSTLAALPRGLRTELLRAVVKRGTPPESLRAALAAAGLPPEPTQAVAALLRREGDATAAPELLRKYLRAAGLGEWSRLGFSPTDDEAPSVDQRDQPDGRPGRLGGTLFGWTPGSVTGPLSGEVHGPAMLSRLQARAGWSDDAVGAEGFTPVIVGGQVRWLRLPDDVADPTLPRLDRPSADPGLWPAAGTAQPASADDPRAEPGDLFPSDDQAVAGVVDSKDRPLRDTAWIRQAMRRAGVAEPGLLLPPALRAALGGRAVPAEVIRAVLGMTPGSGKPASIDSLVELLAPLRSAGGRRLLAPGVARIGPVGPAEAAANRERARLETLADRLGATLATVARRSRALGDPWPKGVGLRLRGGAADVGELLKRVESGDRDLWRRIVTAMGPAATSAEVGETLTPELLRSVLQEGPSYDAEGAGELIGGDRRKSRGLRREAEHEKKSKVEREKQLRARADKEIEVEQERVAEERARRLDESHTEPLGERTLKLVRALFPHSAERLPHAIRRSAFPGGMPASNEPDLMLVAPTTEIIRKEAGALFKENPQADEVRAGASQAPTQQRGDDPARVEKFLSPEKIEEFARRAFEMLIDEISLDAERHGLDPYGFE